MSNDDEEPYSTIFASLKHPIRRRILRMLSKQPMSFSEMTDALGVSNSFLTYHLESLGELLGKTEDGKYRLSSFGEAANATMNKVEDIPTIAPHISQLSKINWFRGRSAVVALGIVCILLIAGLGGTIAYYAIATNSKQNELNSMSNTISSLNSQISQLNSTVANLQKQVASDNSTIASLKSLVANLQNQLTDTAEGVNEQLGLELTMALQKTNYSLGEPVNMTFTITNISNQTISLFQYGVGGFNMFEFQVYNDTDNSVWSLIYPVYPLNPGGPIVTTTLLGSEESLTGVLVWEQMCNNTGPVPVSPGTYYIVGQIGPVFMNGLTIETTPIQIVIA
jgi:DNA-binding transcriptional ArsR family regulator